MAKQKHKRSKEPFHWKEALLYEFIGLGVLAAAIIAILKLGVVGRSLALFVRFFFGNWSTIVLALVVLLSFYIMWKRKTPDFWHERMVGVYFILLGGLIFSHDALYMQLTQNDTLTSPSILRVTFQQFLKDAVSETPFSIPVGGGMIGAIGFVTLFYLFSHTGLKIVSAVFILVGILLVTHKSLKETIGRWIEGGFGWARDQSQLAMTDTKDLLGRKWKERRTKKGARERKVRKKPEQVETDDLEETSSDEPIEIQRFQSGEQTGKRADEEEGPTEQMGIDEQTGQVKFRFEPPVFEKPKPAPVTTEAESVVLASAPENPFYELPHLDLLQQPKVNVETADEATVHGNARKLEETLLSFGVRAKVKKVHLGPAVTKYEVYPDVGVKVSRIVNLTDDLALALAAKDIRIEAPIPGKSAIGIEVPNEKVATVTLREVIESAPFVANRNPLAVALGRDITGQAIVGELNRMPHLLVAGATGSGKSVCINGIIVSILMRAKPSEVKLMMIDPKMVELNVYNGIPHLLSPVVIDPKKAAVALKKVVAEMEQRYELFSESGTRNIEGYNEWLKRQRDAGKAAAETLPYIVVIVDELADLMMVASNDVEDAITRLAQMARASGIHLIIATQRPSVDVITGIIKANIPSRIAFAVSSQTDSRTIIDMGGAEKLLGRGDMLYLPVGEAKPVRVQGAFLSDDEVEAIAQHCIAQQTAHYNEELLQLHESEQSESHEDPVDPLYEEAVALVCEMQSASVSMLQRRFRVGYARAARLIDEMELRGVVGPYEGSKPRTVLIAKKIQDNE
ncbi:MAG: DNA translocase FtsK [Bacilli bacterium]